MMHIFLSWKEESNLFDFGFRNLLLFFKDKTAVILSFLAEFIVAGLYILFIRDNLIRNFSQIKQAELLMDVWMVSGLLGITSVSTTMGAYGIMVDDYVKKIRRDFLTSPIRNTSLLGGYMSSGITIGVLMTFLLFVLSEVYIFCCYGVRPGADRILTVYGILFLTAVSNASLTLLLVSFLKSNNALASCCTILGALIGFLTGIYLPMGSLPESVQMLVQCFPVSHGVVLFRQALMEPLISDSFGSLNSDGAGQFMKYMGIQFYMDETLMPFSVSVIILLIAAVLCMLIAVWRFSREF